MTKAENLQNKGYVEVGKFNSNIISRTFRKIKKMIGREEDWHIIHKNYETVAGTSYISRVFARDEEWEKAFWAAYYQDGRKLKK